MRQCPSWPSQSIASIDQSIESLVPCIFRIRRNRCPPIGLRLGPRLRAENREIPVEVDADQLTRLRHRSKPDRPQCVLLLASRGRRWWTIEA